MQTTDQSLQGQRALWHLEAPIPPELRNAAPGGSVMLAHLLYCRGYRTAEEIDNFFTAPAISYDPFLLPDMEPAVERIGRAIREQERVAVYGDFDCDGIVSAAILISTLRSAGLDPIAHIPSRGDGHGLQPEALASLRDAGATLIVTADCGITALSEVQVALGMGMDIVVTDHHEPRADGSLPNCPTVAPTRHDAGYPCRFLCGAGVTYKLVQALHGRLPGLPPPEEVLDLVALGTVADVVPLRDENRSLVVAGLQRLRRTERPGLLALLAAASIERDRIDPVSVGFYLAPRINAANRMASPRLAFDLITAADRAVADDLAARLSAYNGQRQEAVARWTEILLDEVGPPDALADQVLRGVRAPILTRVGDWQAGISGLLAAKLVDAYGLPAFVGSDSGDGTVSVSARGVPGIHIDEMLEACEAALPGGLFLSFGGHAAAGGFRVERERLEVTLRLLEEQAALQPELEHIGPVLRVDAEVSSRQLSLHAARLVRSLAPFGNEFVEPLFLIRGASLVRRSLVGDGRHARFAVTRERAAIDGVFFNADEEFRRLPLGSRIDAVFHLQLNEWGGRSKPEIRIRDWRLAA